MNVVLVSDRAIRRINKKFLNHDYATDVIAFPSPVPEIFGDVVISSDTAARQASEQAHSLLTELSILAIHGVLHLKGYRDKTKKDSDRMWRKTYEVLARISAKARAL